MSEPGVRPDLVYPSGQQTGIWLRRPLQNVFHEVMRLIRRRTPVVIVIGGAGYGKTALLNLVEAACSRRGISVCRLDGVSALGRDDASPCGVLLIDDADRFPVRELMSLLGRSRARASSAAVLTCLQVPPAWVRAGISGSRILLVALDPAEARSFVLENAQSLGQPHVFAPEALDLLVSNAGGSARVLRSIARAAFFAAKYDGAEQIGPHHVSEALDVLLVRSSPSDVEDSGFSDSDRAAAAPVAPLVLSEPEQAFTTTNLSAAFHRKRLKRRPIGPKVLIGSAAAFAGIVVAMTMSATPTGELLVASTAPLSAAPLSTVPPPKTAVAAVVEATVPGAKALISVPIKEQRDQPVAPVQLARTEGGATTVVQRPRSVAVVVDREGMPAAMHLPEQILIAQPFSDARALGVDMTANVNPPAHMLMDVLRATIPAVRESNRHPIRVADGDNKPAPSSEMLRLAGLETGAATMAAAEASTDQAAASLASIAPSPELSSALLMTLEPLTRAAVENSADISQIRSAADAKRASELLANTAKDAAEQVHAVKKATEQAETAKQVAQVAIADIADQAKAAKDAREQAKSAKQASESANAAMDAADQAKAAKAAAEQAKAGKEATELANAAKDAADQAKAAKEAADQAKAAKEAIELANAAKDAADQAKAAKEAAEQAKAAKEAIELANAAKDAADQAKAAREAAEQAKAAKEAIELANAAKDAADQAKAAKEAAEQAKAAKEAIELANAAKDAADQAKAAREAAEQAKAAKEAIELANAAKDAADQAKAAKEAAEQAKAAKEAIDLANAAKDAADQAKAAKEAAEQAKAAKDAAELAKAAKDAADQAKAVKEAVDEAKAAKDAIKAAREAAKLGVRG